jgi:anti-sigma factor RsiW
MHRTTDELLALRDGDAPPEVARHVDGCASCAAELEELCELKETLCALPELEPESHNWPRIRHAIEADRRRVWRRRVLAAAAVLFVGLSLVASGWLFRDRNVDSPSARAIESDAVIDHLMTASRELEVVLRNPALRSRVLTPREAAQIVVLEDDIAVIDARLADRGPELPPDQAMALWTDRVGLLDELLQARGGSPPARGIQRARF